MPRRMPIAEFCDKIIYIYKPTNENKRSLVMYGRARRIVAFLTQHPSVKTTADITKEVIAEFALPFEHQLNSYRVSSLQVFRRICVLAVEWDCLKRNPFDDDPRLKGPSRAPAGNPRGRELDPDQVLKILDFLKSKCESWDFHRIYVISYIIIETGIKLKELVVLTCSQCDLEAGYLRLEKRMGRSRDESRVKLPKVVGIPARLAEVLGGWMPRRLGGRPNPNPEVKYGFKLSEDRRTWIEDDAEQKVRSEILRWSEQGWFPSRIAKELDSRGIPSKKGNKWDRGTIDRMIKREKGSRNRPDSRSNPGPDWLFPNVSGNGHWAPRTGRWRKGMCEPVRLIDVGESIGIDNLTYESLRRFNLEHSRLVFDLGAGTVEQPKPEAPKQAIPCPLDLRTFGSFPMLGKVEISITLTSAEYAILAALVAGWGQSQGFTYDDLARLTRISAPRKVIEEMAKKPSHRPIVAMIEKSRGRPKFVRLISPPSAS